MLKKIVLLVFTIFLMACSNTMTVTDSNKKDEVIKRIRKELNVYEDGSAILWVATDFVISKNNDMNDKNFQREQEVFVNDLKKKLEERNIKYEIEEDNMDWRFRLPNVINVNGKVAKLENHNKIIQETSNQLINLKIDLIETRQRKVQKYTSEDILGGVAAVVLAPVWIPIAAIYAVVFTVVTIPLFLIEDMKYKNKY